MPGIDKAPGRVVAVIVLLIVAAVALHGYLPGADPPPRDRPTSGLGSLFAVVAMLVVSMAIIVIAIITQSRRRPVSPGAGEPPREMAGERRPLTWRMVLIAVGVVIAWLVLVALLSRLNCAVGYRAATARCGHSADGRAPAPAAAAGGTGAVVERLLPSRRGDGVAHDGGVRRGGDRGPQAAARARQRRCRPATNTGLSTPAAGADSLARAAELGLAEIGDLSREPREAIIACYAAMERELENSPEVVPRESDTPSEVLARAVEHHALRADSATELVDLFEEARFSPHVMTEEHREIAVRVLRLVLAELRSVA